MKTHRHELWFNTPARTAFVNITPQVEEALRASGVKEGLCLVNAMHISASVFINDDERGLHHDFTQWLADDERHVKTRERLRAVDYYFVSLSELRAELTSVLGSCFGKASMRGAPK